MKTLTIQCPICNDTTITIPRYPNKICYGCSLLTITDKGEKIQFFNKNHGGGFKSIVNNIEGDIHDCFVNNIPCYAEEYRYGGIIISKV